MAKILASEDEIHEIEDHVYRRGRGRPREDMARRRVCGVRFDEEELDMIEHLEIETGQNMTEIVRKALRTYYHIQISRL